ncbi:dTDP-4-dehydrorhamnose reductase [Pantoea sp. PA1]|jgi:dTDP-4-dehydrorhamnose reductase|uniref:dTDP-4-dehydrorhamnose reductase n=2 Tax=Pantoea ananas TaxID=553 RepID=UPI0002ECAD7C|nr:dTDP-4-dehydrorhamnose reductase [Pantoea ananatis]ASN14853.1 NAD(P)-dependent oxidoreductase [Pantoea ananatis]MDH0054238.1 dTDP-4-dehydrorhamnose reductase [Pantoea ananatis]MDN4126684.1 dTDP-4-dehydrorhamnose reductase [Pantoea ananatis]MDN4151997.1 dTDP-4-dehydrorhamnose reductase [Pantoea ananatis]MDQ1226248.1 dTDP-4-dehydrorhamnose reductase [Pantoea ananatis]
MRVLLTGAYGQLGRCLLDRFPADWITLACGSAELDITDRCAVMRVVKKFKPDVIMNAAAYTAVDKAETDRTRALKVNAIGPENLAQAAKLVNARLIHISTDYVFDGLKKTTYSENDPPCPINFYGLSKWEGEKRVFEVLPEAIVIRTSWMFSEYGNNFVSTMLRLAQTRSELHVVNDQYGCPTYAGDLAEAMIHLAGSPENMGIYHYCGDIAVSWCEFAQAIFVAAEKEVNVRGITSSQYPSAATRPARSILNTEHITSAGITASDWQEQLITCLKPQSTPFSYASIL